VGKAQTSFQLNRGKENEKPSVEKGLGGKKKAKSFQRPKVQKGGHGVEGDERPWIEGERNLEAVKERNLEATNFLNAGRKEQYQPNIEKKALKQHKPGRIQKQKKTGEEI